MHEIHKITKSCCVLRGPTRHSSSLSSVFPGQVRPQHKKGQRMVCHQPCTTSIDKAKLFCASLSLSQCLFTVAQEGNVCNTSCRCPGRTNNIANILPLHEADCQPGREAHQCEKTRELKLQHIHSFSLTNLSDSRQLNKIAGSLN